MHQALFLPEITRNIFEFLNPFLSGPEGSHQPNPLRLQDLAAVAITCRTLSGPALDVLWDTQLCFGPLLLCLPPSIIEVRVRVYGSDDPDSEEYNDDQYEDRRVYMIRDPLPSDLLRMLPYARRIKWIGLPNAKCRWPLPNTFSIPNYIINWLLSVYPMEIFLPRLTHMRCPNKVMMDDHHDIQDVDISLAPLSRTNLTSLELYPEFDNKVEGWPLFSILVNDLPQLRRITLNVYVWEHYTHVLYSGAIAPLCSFLNLEHLDLTISGRNPEDLGPAGLEFKFPHLLKLKLSSETNFAVGFLVAVQSTVLHTLDLVVECRRYVLAAEHVDQHEHLDRHRLFPSLRCLTISSNFRFMMSLIKAVHASALHSISLTIAPTSYKQIVRSLIALISSKRGWELSLRNITIGRPGPRINIPDDNRECTFSIEDLLVFSHLQHIILYDIAASLNNVLCKNLATGWPDLVEFSFTPRNITFCPDSLLLSRNPLPPVAATVDLGSLVAFARHCPKLSHLQLGVPLDIAELPVLDDETRTILSSRTTRSTCMRLSVYPEGPSPSDPKAVATFLAQVFPSREIKIVFAESFCRQDRCKSSNEWYKVVEWLRSSQPSSLEFGPCYRTQICSICTR